MYTPDELVFNSDTIEEEKRVHRMLDDLFRLAENGNLLSEHEKEFLCRSIKTSENVPVKIEDCDYCQNFYFKYLFLTYWHDLSGKSEFTKLKYGKYVCVSENEKENDFKKLKSIANDWLGIISIENHSEELHKQISKEARDNLKKLFKGTKIDYLSPLIEITKNNLPKFTSLLHTKYIYCMALLILEKYSPNDLSFNLNDYQIEINEYSIIHILTRHYAKSVQTSSKKSFHNENFHPSLLIYKIKDIFNTIDESSLLKGYPINNIAFKFKNEVYMVHIKVKTKQIKNIGNVKYNRLETFYSLTDPNKLKKLYKKHILHMIDENLGVFIEK